MTDGNRFLNRYFNEQGARLDIDLVCMLRHAEKPKGSRRAPTVMNGFIDGPSRTAKRVGIHHPSKRKIGARRGRRNIIPKAFCTEFPERNV